jgi:hypothetical protein
VIVVSGTLDPKNELILLLEIGRNKFYSSFESEEEADTYLTWCAEHLDGKVKLLAKYKKAEV